MTGLTATGRSVPSMEVAEDWRNELDCIEGTNKPICNAANVLVVLSKAPEWIGQVWTDMLQQCRMRQDGRVVRAWSNDDSIELLIWLQSRAGFKHVTMNTVEQGVSSVARLNRRNPLVEYLRSLEWDGENRVSTWLRDYLGADDAELTNTMGRAWLISAVARAIQPGCQVDHCLILEGKQGIKKSTLLRDLAGEQYHAEHTATKLEDKDAAILCSGKWIVEFSELGAVKNNRVETVKSFISRRDDHYRPPYERHAISVQRSCVFAGTTNEEHYLEDQTGNRRYWPVKCYHVAHKQLLRDRDQLWAEAVALYDIGEPWHLTQDMERKAAKEQQKRVSTDVWLEEIRAYVLHKADVSTNDLVVKVFGKVIADVTNADVKRTAACLRLLNWEPYLTNDGKALRRWRLTKVSRRASLNPDRAVID